MKFNMAHIRERAAGGGWIDFAVFDATSTIGDNDGVLHQLTMAARSMGLKIDQSALAYRLGSGVQVFGSPSLVSYLTQNGLPCWTHTITV
ncbi:hypothetical protein ACJ70E_19270 [Pseudomonas plecoglossicida]|uniref:hypothetical protein n=1 Tax=Pseudomonas plecoglossicida TaxID=70775 RepID=UPI00397728E0